MIVYECTDFTWLQVQFREEKLIWISKAPLAVAISMSIPTVYRSELLILMSPAEVADPRLDL